ncbi:hypothetical protein ACMHYB_06145 [Sorangium sp. So ce1128]
MRNVALDMGVREVSFGEVAQQQVVIRRTGSSFKALEDVLAPSAPPAAAHGAHAGGRKKICPVGQESLPLSYL